MSKFGIIYVGYQCADLLKRSLEPWIEVHETQLGGHEWLICAVSMPFEGFPKWEHDDGTHQLLRDHAYGLESLLTSHDPYKETVARGAALKRLVEQGCTYVWQVDSDEFYTVDQIAAITRFVEARSHVDWFRLSFKNLVFTSDQYLADPFTPPRIHKTHNAGGYVAAGFHQDNNVYYERPWNQERVLDTQLPSVLVPKSVAFIAHETWLNNDRSRRKVAYQQARGWNCSFAWDDAQGGLIFNPNLPEPEIVQE
jgi:hypothetical protein